MFRRSEFGSNSATLDGLRGFAALIVVLSHASNLGMNFIPGLSLSGVGKYGVYLFFVLSAFLLTTQWLIGRNHSPQFLLRYLVRRSLRIYPLYAVVLCVGWALSPRGLGVPLDGSAVWRHLTLREGFDIYWSVPVEFLYYFLVPPIGLFLGSRLSWQLKVSGFAAVVLGCLVLFPPSTAPTNSTQLLYYIPILLSGSLAAWIWQRRFTQHHANPLTPWRFAVLDILTLCSLLLTFPSVLQGLGLNIGADALHRSFIGWGAYWSLILLALLAGWLPWWARVLQVGVLRACGRWCFGIYLLHMPALYFARSLPIFELLKPWVGLGLALLTAAVVFRFIEKPAIRLGARL